MAGLVVAAIGVPALMALAPDGTVPRAEMIRIDAGVLGFTLVVSVLTGIGFGLVPALRTARQALRDTLSQGGRSVTGGHERLRNTLAVAEVALALILLAGAGLLLKSFLHLRAVDPGFVPDHVITLTVDLPDAAYQSAERMRAFHTDLLARLSALPEVVAAGTVNWRPLGQALIRGDFQVEGGYQRPDGFIVAKPVISPGYFRTMGIRLQRGRDFATSDTAAATGVAIVSEWWRARSGRARIRSAAASRCRTIRHRAIGSPSSAWSTM